MGERESDLIRASGNDLLIGSSEGNSGHYGIHNRFYVKCICSS